MRITELRQMSADPYKTKADLAEAYKLCVRTVGYRVKEIEAEVKAGRYPEHSVIRDGQLLWVNQLVWIDYMCNRKKLLEKNLRKFVPPYNPKEIAHEIGWYADTQMQEAVNE